MENTTENNNQYKLNFGDHTISFCLVFKKRKTLSISVHPDQSIIVTAPETRQIDEIIKIVRKRASWILKQKVYFERFKPLQPPRKYVAGETHLYLGNCYRLKIFPSDTENVKLVRGYFQVFTQDPENAERVKTLLDSWYFEHGKKIFEERLQKCHKLTERFEVPPYKDLVIRKMQKRWGSCGSSGRIIINTELIKAPLRCIDYVILHEICHLKYPNHNKDFYRLLELCMPDWKQRKEKLECVQL